MSPIIRPLGMSTDDEEDAPLSLRCAVSVVSERTREERDAVLLAAAIDLTDDTEPQPAPTAVAPVPLAASVILLLSDSEEEEDAPLAKRPHRAANPPSDEDTPLSYRPRQKAATSRLASGSSTHTFQLPARVSDDEDAPLTARVRTKRQRRPEDSGAGGAAAAGGADGAVGGSDKRSPVRRRVDEVAEDAATALAEAIDDGYGHGSPLDMTVYIQSEYGRHRSVVIVEAAAIALRNMLRKNKRGRFGSTTVSVGTRHRDIDNAHRDEEAFGHDLRREAQAAKKQKEREERESR